MSLEIKIKKNYGEFKLNIEYKGESRRIGILGASGSGKSLTLKTISGIERPDEGFVKIDGRVLFDSNNNVNITPQKRKTGYMFQSLALFDNMSVEQNIKAGIGRNADITAQEIMERFGLSNIAGRRPHELSQGQKQRTALARILASEPSVILLDEPFSSLDFHIRDEMQESLISMLENFDGTVITVSHSLEEIYALSDELIVIDNGNVCAVGITEDIFNSPPDSISAVLTGCENIAHAEYMDGKIYIPDWGIELSSPNKDVSHVALRARSFYYDERGGMLCLFVKEPNIKKTPFGCTVYFKPSEKASEKMCIKISSSEMRYNGIPDRIYVDERDFIMLK